MLHTYLVYNTVVRLCNFFCSGGKVNFVQIFLLNPNFLLVNRKFSSRTYAIVPQKYRELSMQVETHKYNCNIPLMHAEIKITYLSD